LGRPREHLEVVDAATRRNCLGVIQGIYVRKGAGSGRWVKLGEMCLRCHAFYPVAPEASAEAIVARVAPDAYLGVTDPYDDRRMPS
jgi:hypothetical protein